LLPAVLLNGGRILLSVLIPVARIVGAPFPRTVETPLAVFGVGADLSPVILGAPLSLALGFAADGLARLELRWLEQFPAVKATPFTHKGVCLTPQDSGFRDWRALETDVE
jgi:hypothetical protein